MTEKGEERQLEDKEPRISQRRARRIARAGLAGSAEKRAGNPPITAEEILGLTESFQSVALAAIDTHGGEISYRFLFYVLTGININEATSRQRTIFNRGINSLVEEEVIKKHEKLPRFMRTIEKTETFLLPTTHSPKTERKPQVELAHKMVIPRTFKQDVLDLFSENNRKIQVEDVISKLFAGEDISGKNYETLVAAMESLVKSGVITRYNQYYFLVTPQLESEEPPIIVRPQRRRQTKEEEARLTEMLNNAGMDSKPAVKPPGKGKKTKKRRDY